MTPSFVPFSPQTPPQVPDEELLARVAAGDPPALGLLFRRHHAALFRFCTRLVGPAADPEDLVQSTFLAVWSQAKRFRGGARVTTWIFGIAANLARRQRRTEGRRRTALAVLATVPPREDPLAADVLARRQLLERLPAALERLSHDLRVAYVFCEIEEVPGPEAARVLGVPQGTLWRRLHDARRRLVELLEEKP